MKEALLYEMLPDSRVRCILCAHRCVIAGGKRGVCRVCKNQGGTPYTLVYGHVISENIDSIEKKAAAPLLIWLHRLLNRHTRL